MSETSKPQEVKTKRFTVTVPNQEQFFQYSKIKAAYNKAGRLKTEKHNTIKIKDTQTNKTVVYTRRENQEGYIIKSED